MIASRLRYQRLATARPSVSAEPAAKVDVTPGILVLGSGPLATTIITRLQTNPRPGYRFMGYVETMNGEYRDRIKDLLAEGGVKCVVVALSERRGTLPTDELLDCKANGISVEDGVTFYEKLSGKISLAGLNPSALIFSDGFKRLRFAMLCKRIVDVAVSAIGLILATPFLLIIPLAIKLDSQGPVVFRQERVGQHGRMVRLYKFRSMRCGPESHDQSRWAQKHDARLTRVGALIRRCRLDELPQLWNVLRGDMSFVGPRPDVQSLWDTLVAAVPYYRLRAAVKPGITGWAQVRYHYVSSIEDGIERHEYDLYYIKNMSVWLDVRIIIETLKIVMLGRGAH